MKALLLASVFFISGFAKAQYYYKDIVGTKESSENIKTYLKNKVTRVVLTSYDENNTKSDDLNVQQEFSPANKTLRTITTTPDGQSVLISFVDENGNVIKTIDSSNIVVSVTNYTYDAAGNLVSSTSSSADTLSSESEQHIWQWDNNKPVRMLRIKNKFDTTFVNFKLDENGNVVEETETHKGLKSQPVYYYYNTNNQLTDVVQFSKRANRLLPEYMFEYSPSNQVIQKITVPSNNSEYLIWRYQYNTQGLKIKEAIYNKQKQLTGKVEYQYSFGS